MPPSTDEAIVAARFEMHRQGFEEVSAVPAVPVTVATGVRYDAKIALAPRGELWYLRSFGTAFVIIPRGWLRTGPRRCYSLGDGLVLDAQSHRLLLAQAVLSTAAEAEGLASALAAALRPRVSHWASEVGQLAGRPCLTVAAELRAATHCLDDSAWMRVAGG
jgi:hypothetical protein